MNLKIATNIEIPAGFKLVLGFLFKFFGGAGSETVSVICVMRILPVGWDKISEGGLFR